MTVGCGGESSVVTIGNTELGKSEVHEWLEVRGGLTLASEVSVDFSVVSDVLTELVVYESLLDLMADYGFVPDQDDVVTARDRLEAAGFDADPIVLERISRWQAGIDALEAGVPPVVEAYSSHSALVSHEICTSHILLAREQDTQDLLERIEDGGDFADFAMKLSQDPGSGSQGGVLGCVPVGSFVAPFERAVFGALATEKSLVGPVPSRFGFHVIKIDEIRPTAPVSFEELGSRSINIMLAIASITGQVSIDPRYGVWDGVVGRVTATGVGD